MRTIDGSQGEGGGQVLRTALSLSLLSGEPLRLVHIRAGRQKPGLLRQHLAAVRLAAAVGQAEVSGDEAGSRELVFKPRGFFPGDYRAVIGSAGSTSLVAQAVLPALLCAGGPSRLLLEGGTHNPKAPPAEFLARAWAPLVGRQGPKVSVRLERAGFYPAGGGRLCVEVVPAARLSPLLLRERGPVRRVRAVATVAGLPGGIARRELAVLQRRLALPPEALELVQLPDGQGPGNVVWVEVEAEHVTEVFTGFGEKGVSAEAVAERVAAEAKAWLDSGVPVGAHLCDQLLFPLALGGGALRTLPLSSHARTQLSLLEACTGARFEVREEGGAVELTCSR